MDKKSSSWLSRIFKYASYIAIGSTGFVLFLASIQHHLIYLPNKYGKHSYDRYVTQLFKQCNGVRVINEVESLGHQTSYYIPPTKLDLSQPQKLWIFTFGNAALGLYFMPFLKWLQDQNDILSKHHALIIDYPGFGENAGSPSPQSIKKSMIAAVDKVIKTTPHLDGHDLQIGLVGHSLGAAAALSFANHENVHKKVSKLVLISPFTSMNAMAKIVLPLPGLTHMMRYLLRHHYDNDQEIIKFRKQAADVPITIIHGQFDAIVPVMMGQELSKIVPNVDFHVLNCDHNDIFEAGKQEILNAMLIK